MQAKIFAYLAGAIDSDGTIGIKKSTYAMRKIKDCNAPTYSERLALRQVTPEIPRLLQEQFGGALYITKPYSKNGRHLYSWQITDQKAVTCLKALLPYLRVKRPQALNCLELRKFKERSKKQRVKKGRGYVGSAARCPKISAEMERLYERAKALNKVGV